MSFGPLADEKSSQQPNEHWYTNAEMNYWDTEETLTNDSTEPKPRRRKVKRSSQVSSLKEGPEVEVQDLFSGSCAEGDDIDFGGGRWVVKSSAPPLGTQGAIIEIRATRR